MKESYSKSRLQFEGFTSTPPLWKRESFYGLNPFLLSLKIPNPGFDPEQILPELQSNYVLGKRAESFFELAVNSSDQFEVLASRVQISRERITIGELDFLLKDKNINQVTHVELVYKFYIYDPSFSEEMQRWIGPNRKDSLLRKIERLKNHQVPLLHKKETRAILEGLGIDSEKVEQKVFFPASLFVPKHLLNSSFPYLNNDCLTGYWIFRKDFTQEDYSENYFYTPKKQDWPILPHSNNIWYSFEKIKDQVNELLEIKKAPLIWMKTAEGNFERFFIVWW